MSSSSLSPNAPGGPEDADTPAPDREGASGPPFPVCRIPETIRIKGKLKAEEDLAIEGSFEGEIDLPDRCLTIHEHANVRATIFARDVTVYGALTGRVTATEIVDIRDTASVEGAVVAQRIMLGENAVVRARLVTRRRMEAAAHVARYRRDRTFSDQ